jgi:RNA polymerase sigma-70 factor, ECF subfamily
MMRADSSERLLIEAAQSDPCRFADLYELHFDRVYAYISRRVRNRAAVQDLTADVFEHALSGIKRYEWRGLPFAAWLFRIASNRINDYAGELSHEASVPSSISYHEPDYEEVERQALLFKAVRDLPSDQRRVIELRFIDQKSIRDAAVLLERSEGAVKQLQFRALDTLRARMGEHHG